MAHLPECPACYKRALRFVDRTPRPRLHLRSLPEGERHAQCACGADAWFVPKGKSLQLTAWRFSRRTGVRLVVYMPTLPECPACYKRKLTLVESTRRPRSGERHAHCACGADAYLVRTPDGSAYNVASFRANRPLPVTVVRAEEDA